MFTDPARALDASAISLSTLCLIHCLVLPLLTGLVPMLAAAHELAWLHRAFVCLALPITGLAVWQNMRMPASKRFATMATTGLVLLLLGAFAPLSHALETSLTVAGGLCLAVAHGLRWADHRARAHSQTRAQQE